VEEAGKGIRGAGKLKPSEFIFLLDRSGSMGGKSISVQYYLIWH